MSDETALRAFLFADLRDYTAFVEREGDRAAAQLIGEYRALIREHLLAHEGAELKTEGDSFYIVFPSPSKAIAFGADVFRAAQTTSGRRLKFGVGVHVGETVLLEGQFVGSAVNIAARIGAIAGDGELLVSDTVRGLVRTNSPFAFEDRGTIPLKGVAEPIRIYAVEWAPIETASPRPAATPAPQLGVFVGRSEELRTLVRAATALGSGHGGVVLLGGAAGLGKTRLIREWAAPSAIALLIGGCGATDARLPYEPFTAMLRELTRASTEEARLRRVAPELLTFLPELVAGERGRQTDRDTLFGAMLRLIRDLARGGAIALVVEDLHWADDGTLALLRFLAGLCATTPFLLVGTYRDDELPRGHPLRSVLAELERRPEVTRISLRPLPVDDADRLLAHAQGVDPLDVEERSRIVALAEGNPLFLEELARSREPGEGLPLTVAEAVVRRVAALDDDARQLVTYAAIAGQHVGFDLLQQMLGRPERDVLRAARVAIDAFLLVESGEGLEFRHALTREAVYRDLMKRERRLLHREVAEALALIHGDDPGCAADIERQFLDAGSPDQAVRYALIAGEEALRLLASGEAVGHFERAVDASGPATLERARALEGLGRGYRLQLLVSKAVTTLREAVALYRTVGTQADVARGQAALARAHPFGPEEREAWLEVWRASQESASPAELSGIALTLADRAYELMDDADAQQWAATALARAEQSGVTGRLRSVEANLLPVTHPPGWHVQYEVGLARQLDQAIDRDENVLTAYRRYLDSRSREATADERQALLARARAYATTHGISAVPRTLIFRAGPPWMLWLTGEWDDLAWLWSELGRLFPGDDVWEIFPDTGPLAAAVRLEREGLSAIEAVNTAAERRARSGTWNALVASTAYLTSAALAKGDAVETATRFHELFSRRTPQALDLPSFLLATRVVAPAALLARDRAALVPWLAAEEAIRGEGAMFGAALDQLRAVDHALRGEESLARDLLAQVASLFGSLGWDHLAAELAWQRARIGDPSGLEAARTFYRTRGANWRLHWLEEETWR